MDYRELPSPYAAAAASLVTFAVGALHPAAAGSLLPAQNLALALGLALGLAAGSRGRRRRAGGPADRPAVLPRARQAGQLGRGEARRRLASRSQSAARAGAGGVQACERVSGRSCPAAARGVRR